MTQAAAPDAPKSKPAKPAYLNASLPMPQRVADLIGRMTIQEKCTQMLFDAPAVERLGIPAYNWWNECLHGVGRSGIATVFPQAIGMAASWNVDLMQKVASAIADEGRAKYHHYLRRNDADIYKGLTFWTPNVNIFRDGRWGRGQETYGEDPYLTGRMGVAFVKGLQGDHPKYLKSVATPKHYAVHSGPEPLRHGFDAIVSKKDLRETYLPAFRDTVVEGKALSVMGAYNRVNGEACCASKTLLQEILRDEWGFEGYVVSDCMAICDIHEHHKITHNATESAALATENGCDLNCGKAYHSLLAAVQGGLLSEASVDRALTRLFMARFRLGMFDPPAKVPFARTPFSVVDCPKHRDLNIEMARQSIVLLKNEGNVLPLKKNVKTIAVIGPNAYAPNVLLGNYNGTPSESITPLDGIRRAVSKQTRVLYQPGCFDFSDKDNEWVGRASRGFAEALEVAEQADVIVAVMGLTPDLEGEEMGGEGGGDRVRIGLVGMQEQLLQALHATGKPVVLVLLNGSPISITWAAENVPAIVEAWYPGAQGGRAIADVLFGDCNPAGRLPVTIVKCLADVPDFKDYAMKNRTYRYMEAEPLYPFGFGLSYTTFAYDKLKIKPAAGGSFAVSVEVTNTGKRDGDEVVQLYVTDEEASVTTPKRDLRGFKRITIKRGQKKRVAFTLTPRDLSLISNDGNRILEPGWFTITVGGCQEGLKGRLEVIGQRQELPY
ncbi:MAG: glycoside hydrolase family 3 C-terminal domain-containing protein [Planctomycetaceae bacterium]